MTTEHTGQENDGTLRITAWKATIRVYVEGFNYGRYASCSKWHQNTPSTKEM